MLPFSTDCSERRFSYRKFAPLFSIAIALELVACPQQSPPTEIRIGLIAGFTGETAAAIGQSSTEISYSGVS